MIDEQGGKSRFDDRQARGSTKTPPEKAPALNGGAGTGSGETRQRRARHAARTSPSGDGRHSACSRSPSRNPQQPRPTSSSCSNCHNPQQRAPPSPGAMQRTSDLHYSFWPPAAQQGAAYRRQANRGPIKRQTRRSASPNQGRYTKERALTSASMSGPPQERRTPDAFRVTNNDGPEVHAPAGVACNFAEAGLRSDLEQAPAAERSCKAASPQGEYRNHDEAGLAGRDRSGLLVARSTSANPVGLPRLRQRCAAPLLPDDVRNRARDRRSAQWHRSLPAGGHRRRRRQCGGRPPRPRAVLVYCATSCVTWAISGGSLFQPGG